MSKFDSNTVASIIDARIAEKPEQKKKWEVERGVLTSEKAVEFMTAAKVDIDQLKVLPIYGVQKIRKLIQFAAGLGRASIDPCTKSILENAATLHKKKVAFSPVLQRAALDCNTEAEAKLKLSNRGTYTKGTATSQSGTTRKAMIFLNMATVDQDKSLVVDMKNPVVQKFIEA